MDDLDSTIDVIETEESKANGTLSPSPTQGRVLIGSIEQYFERLGVAAIKLTGKLSVGDIIEIGNEEEAVRQKVSSMQINREDITVANEGDDVGIKVLHPVSEGSSVYKIER